MEINISVFIVSYNQKDYIDQAIQSVLSQSYLPFELVISDDCSTDGTWEIIQSYANRYPQLIKANRNEPNLGIFQNFNKATSLTTGNLVTCVAGDDFIKPGYFEAVYNCINDNGLNPDTDSFILIPNVIKLLESGEEINHSNYQFKDKSVIGLTIRGILDDRYGVVSRASLNRTSDFIENIGIHADYVWGVDRVLNTSHFYFIDGYYPVYREGIGVSAIQNREKEILASKSWIKAAEIVIEQYKLVLLKRDIRFIKYLKAKYSYLANRTFKAYCQLFILTIINLDNFGIMRRATKAVVFLFLPRVLKKYLFKIRLLEQLSK